VDANLADVSPKLLALSDNNKTTNVHRAEEPTSGRPSLEITTPDSPTAQLTRNPERRPGVVFSGLTSNPRPRQARSMPSTSPRLAPTTEEGNKFPSARRGSRAATKSQSGSRAASQSNEKRLSATFSRFAGRRSRDKVSSDGEADESALDSDEAISGDMKLGPAAHSEVRAPSKEYDRSKLTKEKGREKRLERECVLM
jgi:hypothetical protein